MMFLNAGFADSAKFKNLMTLYEYMKIDKFPIYQIDISSLSETDLSALRYEEYPLSQTRFLKDEWYPPNPIRFPKANKANYTEVRMNDGQVSTGGLRTGGVNGCNVLMVRSIMESPHGCVGIMTHYDPNHLEENIERLRELVHANSDILSGRRSAVLLRSQLAQPRSEKLKYHAKEILGETDSFRTVDYFAGFNSVWLPGLGDVEFDVSTGRYDFTPFCENEDNKDFRSVV